MSLGDLPVCVPILAFLSRSSGSRPAHGESSDMCFLRRLVPKSKNTFVTKAQLSATLVKTYPAWRLIGGGTYVFALSGKGVKKTQVKYQGVWEEKGTGTQLGGGKPGIKYQGEWGVSGFL